MMMNNEFTTQSLQLAIGIYTTGRLRFLECRKASPSRVQFVFADPEHLAAQIELEFTTGVLAGPVVTTLAAQRFLRKQTAAILKR